MRDDVAELLIGVGLDPVPVYALAKAALEEDLDGGVDVTSVATVPFDLQGTTEARPREAGVVAGLPVALAVLDVALEGDFLLDHVHADGASVQPGETVLAVTGLVRGLLTAERTLLNLLCHLSGVATLTRKWADALASEGAHTRVRDTRKTTPGMRALEKYAVRCGGGVNHRMSLSDAALVKDNHVAAAGGVAQAFQAVRDTWPGLTVEVECDTLDQVDEALAAGVDLILLDNMSLAELTTAATACKAKGVVSEASGGLTLANAAKTAATGVDFVSIGALTHSAPVLDLGLDLKTL